MLKYNNNSSILMPDGSILYTLHSPSGKSEMLTYSVFPGVHLIYNSIHTGCCSLDTFGKDNMIVMHYCSDGRLEQHSGDDFFYLIRGNFIISNNSKANMLYTFPLSHYHGISIVIDPEKAPKCFSCLLEDVEVQPIRIADRLCGSNGAFFIKDNTRLSHIFDELYNVPDGLKKGYFKVKILELLLLLSTITSDLSEKIPLSSVQVDTAKKIALYLAQNLDSHITVDELARKFHISPSHIQKAFKGVYGIPVFSYVRVLKMQSAAVKLISTDLSVLDIAGSFGYDNASKFSSAFRDIMGETPLEYRKNHRK